MSVTLIGYRGCGKSSVAPLIAADLGWEWADSDREIEALAGKSIAEIFADSGEGHFRDLESDVLSRLCEAAGKIVIAAGGGAILREENRLAMKNAGPVVWLRAEVQTLAARIGGDPGTSVNRPSLTGADVVQEIHDVLEFRQPLYADAATIQVSTDDRGIESIQQEVVIAVRQQLSSSSLSSSGGPSS